MLQQNEKKVKNDAGKENNLKLKRKKTGHFSKILKKEIISFGYDLDEIVNDDTGETKYKVKPTISNIVNNVSAIKTVGYKLFYNEFNDVIYLENNGLFELEDHHVTLIQEDIQVFDKYLAKSKNSFIQSIESFAHHNTFNPIHDYFKKLPKWDKVERLDKLFIDYFGTEDNIYTRKTARIMLLGAVWRAFKPGTKFDTMCILHGTQGFMKGTFLRNLAPSFDDFVTLNSNLQDKDAMQKLKGKLFIEIEEMQSYSKADINFIKGYLSEVIDNYRKPYGRVFVNQKRTCVFWGTTNQDEFLRDDTGERRFLPIKCNKKADIKSLLNHKSQIWAEAYEYFRQGELCYIHEELPYYDEYMELKYGKEREVKETDAMTSIILREAKKIGREFELSELMFIVYGNNSEISKKGLQRGTAKILKENNYTIRKSNGKNLWKEPYEQCERLAIQQKI